MSAVTLTTLSRVLSAAAAASSFGVVDDDFIPAPPSTLVKTGQFAKDVSVIAGWNANDASFFTSTNITTEADVVATLVGYEVLKNSTISKILELYPVEEFANEVLPNDTVTAQFYRASRIVRDLAFTCPAVDVAFHVAKYAESDSVTARLYELNQTAFAASYAEEGAAYLAVSHFSDISYVFNEVSYIPGAAPEDSTLAAEMSGSWAAFAANGDPEKVKAGNGTTLGSWPVAFTDVKGEGAVEMAVNVIGGPSSGPGTITGQNGTGPLDGEKLVVRCAYINTLYDQVQT